MEEKTYNLVKYLEELGYELNVIPPKCETREWTSENAKNERERLETELSEYTSSTNYRRTKLGANQKNASNEVKACAELDENKVQSLRESIDYYKEIEENLLSEEAARAKKPTIEEAIEGLKHLKRAEQPRAYASILPAEA